ncbi:MAG TPA: glycosyltransferase family 39 protein [Candidatus Angelobacter sp.]|jgi:hypothetical protein|nr:glycosyltransferase family 39 protein [Candidatus Angelobacter sp.]
MAKLLELLRRNWLFFAVTTLAALGLRLFFVFKFPHISGDTFIYGDIARNWLNHRTFGLMELGEIRPTLIRLPGYPAFLAVMFKIFGQEHYTAVMVVQALIDTNLCLVIAAIALELMNEKAAKAAYLLAALCPFIANYVAAPMSETLSIFCTAHAFYYGIRGLKELQQQRAGTSYWVIAGLWSAAGTYMRPDGILVLAALGLGVCGALLTINRKSLAVAAGAAVLLAALLPLVPWTIRNGRVFGVFQPLASRYANDPGEFVPMGFNRWVKTWMVDYVSVEEIYWNEPGTEIDLGKLPERAFDSRQEYEKTQQLLERYNQRLEIDPALDADFGKLAQERIIHNPFRYYVWLPSLRIADMWLRPRTENLPVDTRWWEFSEHRLESFMVLLWAGLNAWYLLLALRGWANHRLGIFALMLIGFVVLRSLFLGTLENPEPRYVLQCFPVVLALGGGAFARAEESTSKTAS